MGQLDETKKAAATGLKILCRIEIAENKDRWMDKVLVFFGLKGQCLFNVCPIANQLGLSLEGSVKDHLKFKNHLHHSLYHLQIMMRIAASAVIIIV